MTDFFLIFSVSSLRFKIDMNKSLSFGFTNVLAMRQPLVARNLVSSEMLIDSFLIQGCPIFPLRYVSVLGGTPVVSASGMRAQVLVFC